MKRWFAICLVIILTLSLSACAGMEKMAEVTSAISDDKGMEKESNKKSEEGFTAFETESSLKIKELKTDKKKYEVGEEIVLTLHYSGIKEDESSAWAGIIESDVVEHGDEEENDAYDIEYVYLSGLEENQYTFYNILTPGNYDIRVFDDDGGGVEVAYISFQVIDSKEDSKEDSKKDSKEVKTGNFGEGERTMDLWSGTLNPAEHPIRTVTKTEADGVTTITTLGMDYTDESNPKMYMDIDMDGIKTTMLMMDNKMYSILHEEKMVLVMQQDEEVIEEYAATDYEDEIFSEEVSWSSGTKVLHGETFDYEEMVDDSGNSTCFYYKKGSNTLRYLVTTSGEYIMEQEYLEYNNKVPDEWFELPEDYTVFDMS